MSTDRKFLYSPSFGGDWSFNKPTEIAKLYLFDEAIIAFVEKRGKFTYGDTTPRMVHPERYDDEEDSYYLDYSTLHPLLRDLRSRILAVDADEYTHFGGATDLEVGTCPAGARFRITCYDGNESFVLDTTAQRWF